MGDMEKRSLAKAQFLAFQQYQPEVWNRDNVARFHTIHTASRSAQDPFLLLEGASFEEDEDPHTMWAEPLPLDAVESFSS
jgi:hypothetical protein